MTTPIDTTCVETVTPDLVDTKSRRMKRINRAYLRGQVVRGVKWTLIAAGTVAVINHVCGKKDDKDQTPEEEK